MHVRVVSWNIAGGRRGLADRLKRLRELVNPDVVLLHEVPRHARHALESARGFDWARLAALFAEPEGGPSARSGPAILRTGRVRLRDSGQVPRQSFVRAGDGAGLNEAEVDGIGWRHKTVYVDVEIDGNPVRLCSSTPVQVPMSGGSSSCSTGCAD